MDNELNNTKEKTGLVINKIFDNGWRNKKSKIRFYERFGGLNYE